MFSLFLCCLFFLSLICSISVFLPICADYGQFVLLSSYLQIFLQYESYELATTGATGVRKKFSYFLCRAGRTLAGLELVVGLLVVPGAAVIACSNQPTRGVDAQTVILLDSSLPRVHLEYWWLIMK